jgi:toxin ParE1/3/4
MARRIVWAPSARNDLESIFEYLRKTSPLYAKRFLIKIRESARSLKEFPDRGRFLPEYPESGVREIFVDSFRLMYRIVHDSIEIVGVVHTARDFTSVEPND